MRGPSAGGKKVGSILELTERVGLEIARRFAQDTNRSGPARQGQQVAPARQGASANYDSWRGAAGASESRE